MTDYKQLCAELLDELEFLTDWTNAAELKKRTRIALVKPEPEGPTDEPVIPNHYRGDDIRVYREGFHAGYKYAFQLMPKYSDRPAQPSQSDQLTTMTDFRTLCAELHTALEKHDLSLAEYRLFGPSAAALRAALAEPEPEGPTDEDLSDLWSWSAGQDQGPWPTQQHCFARAVLARWGNHPGSLDGSAQPS